MPIEDSSEKDGQVWAAAAGTALPGRPLVTTSLEALTEALRRRGIEVHPWSNPNPSEGLGLSAPSRPLVAPSFEELVEAAEKVRRRIDEARKNLGGNPDD